MSGFELLSVVWRRFPHIPDVWAARRRLDQSHDFPEWIVPLYSPLMAMTVLGRVYPFGEKATAMSLVGS